MIVPLGRPSYGAASSRCMRSLRCIGSFGRTNDLTSFKKWVNLSSRFEGHSIAGCLIVLTRVLPPLSIPLPTHCTYMTVPLAIRHRLWLLLSYCPYEASQFTRDRSTCLYF